LCKLKFINKENEELKLKVEIKIKLMTLWKWSNLSLEEIPIRTAIVMVLMIV